MITTVVSDQLKIKASDEQEGMISSALFHVNPKTALYKNTMGIIPAPTASGKTTVTFSFIIPEALNDYSVVLFQTTSRDNIENIESKYGDAYDDYEGVKMVSNESKKDILNVVDNQLRKNRKVVIVITHKMFDDIGFDVAEITKEYSKSLLIIKDEASQASISGKGAGYAVLGQDKPELYSKNMQVLTKCLDLGQDVVRSIGLTGTPTEEQTKSFRNVDFLKEDMKSNGVPYIWNNNSLVEFIKDSTEFTDLDKISIGNYASSDIYEIIHTVKETRVTKSYIGNKYFYDLRQNGVASSEVFKQEVKNMFTAQQKLNVELSQIRSEMIDHKLSLKDQPYKSMSLIFAGHEDEDDTAQGKTLLLWNHATQAIEEVCDELSYDKDRVLLYTADICKTLSGKDMSHLKFQNIIDSGKIDAVVVKNKLIDGYDEPRFKFVMSARELEQKSRERELHVPSILRAGQINGRAQRTNNQLPGVWDRNQLKDFLQSVKKEDHNAYSLYLRWILLTNYTEIHVPSSPTMNYAVYVDVKSAGTLEEFLEDINVSDDEIVNEYSNFIKSKTPWSQEGTDEYKDHRECEVCKKVHHDDFGVVPACEIGYLMQGWQRPKIWLTNDIDHIDGNHKNNCPDNLRSTCKPQHDSKSRESGDYIPQKYKEVA